MRFGLFWQTPGYEGSAASRRHWETIEEIVLPEQLGKERGRPSQALKRLVERWCA